MILKGLEIFDYRSSLASAFEKVLVSVVMLVTSPSVKNKLGSTSIMVSFITGSTVVSSHDITNIIDKAIRIFFIIFISFNILLLDAVNPTWLKN